MDEKEYTLVEHLKDLRKSIFRALLGVVVAMFACFAFAEKFLAWLREPIYGVLGSNAHFIVLAPHEYFFVEMKAALVLGLFVASPWVLYQVWCFIAPGLHKHEKIYMFSFVFFGAFFFIAGALFCYYVVFPPMFQFFIGTLPQGVEGHYAVGDLFSFSIGMLVAFGAVFEAPVVVFLLSVLGIVEVESFQSYRRYVIVLAFVVAAVLTPTPDPLTQTFMAVPMIILYEVGILAAKVFAKKVSVKNNSVF